MLCYKCVTGATPDDAVDRQISDSIKSPSALGIKIEEGFEYALMKGMSVQYTDRFQSIDEMLDSFNGKKETVHITKNKPQNEDDVKTELLFTPDTSATSNMPPYMSNTPHSTGLQKNTRIIVSSSETGADSHIKRKKHSALCCLCARFAYW